jgi:hypothetical protein
VLVKLSIALLVLVLLLSALVVLQRCLLLAAGAQVEMVEAVLVDT